MDGFPRRTFCALLAASAGSIAGCNELAPNRSTQTDRPNEGGTVTTVSTRNELQRAFDTLSPGDTIRITDENAPYRTTQWLDIDVDGVTVIGPGVQTLVKPADGADVGGFRVGHNERCQEIDIRGIGYHGNPSGQSEDAERLHGVAIQDATNVTVQRSYIRRTYPVKHGNGGSGISVTQDCSNIRIFNNQIHDYGDRGIQLAGRRHVVFGNVVTTGLDRPVACDLWSSGSQNPAAQSVSIFGNLLGDSVEGSLLGIAGHTPASSSEKNGYVSIFGNVGFGAHKSFCHLRGPDSLRNINVQNNVSLQNADGLETEGTTKFSGIAVDVSKIRNLAVKNNEFYGYSGHGVRVDSDASDVTIQHNTLARLGLTGVRFVGGSDGLIDGNLVTNTGEAGIRLEGATDTVVRGNFVRNVGTAGILVGGGRSPTGVDVADNYVKATNQKDSQTSHAIFVDSGGVRVRGNSIRQNGTAAIVEPADVDGNVYENNWADGDRPWQFASPASRARDNAPPTDVHRGVSADSGDETVRIDFERAYARPPQLTFGRHGGGIADVSYTTDGDGNYDGARITTGRREEPLDVFVSDP